MQHRLTIDYGDDVLFSSGLTRGAFDEEARFLLAAKLYEVGRPTYPIMAQLELYRSESQEDEVALARSAAPARSMRFAPAAERNLCRLKR